MGQTVGVQLLGPTTLIVDGQFVELGSVRQRRLLAALALDVGTVVSADRLADRVWADGELPDDPRRALRTNLARLRQAIGDVEAIATESTGWRLDETQVELDTRRFDELVSAAAQPGIDVHGRLARLDEALALWRGGAYEDMAGEDWVRAESTRLEELKLTAVERRYDAMLAAGMHTDALPGLAGEVDANPLRDRLVGLQMLALYRSGRQAEATRVYEQHRRHLADELGLEPGAKLHELDSRIVAGDPSLHLTSTAGTPLRSYRLGEQLGEGAFAVVYRGTQPSVGRDVAVKVIRAELANRPEFVRRFEAEAHLVARLEHPYIVPLYDYWREPDRACLVFRYLRGGTLEARLTSGGPLTLDECAAMVEQIGAALATAHAEGVVHRDVKPANVFLDEVGNFYLGDFGIALEATEVSDPTAALSAGSPAYASPEQLRREPIGPPADVHGLGISLYESLTGRLPFPAAASQAELLQHQLHDPIPDVRAQRSEVSPAVDAVIQRATAKHPVDRYQTVQELMADFKAALRVDPAIATTRRGSATVVSTGETRNPYKGLRAFTEADSGDFYGRERLVDRLIALMSQTGTTGRIAAVVGPSGIGKSSVVRAGLLPALRRGEAPGSAEWFVATMLPGANPFDELAAALLRVATHAPDNLMGLLTDDRRGIARVVKAVVPEDDGSDVLLVIDQFEELFTLTAQADTVRFLDALEHAVTDARCPLRVVLTMRADFWDRPLRHGAFARLIDASTVNVTALAPDELERAIVAPAHHFGVEFEPGLVSEIVADVNDQPGALPLLQYALTELWDRQIGGLLTRESYGELGGVTGALARRAEEIYSGSSPVQQDATRRLFGRLVTLGEGTEDIRRRATRSEVGDDPATTSVIEAFGTARLLSFDHDPSTREPTLEVAHEALIREWPRLRGWLDDDRDGLRVHRHVTDTTAAWIASGRDDGELYRGGRLETAASWAAGRGLNLNADEGEFLDASVAAHEAEQAAERENLEHQVRSNRRLRVLVAIATVVAVIAAVAGVFAFRERSRAEDAAARAQEEAAEAAARTFEAESARLAEIAAAHQADFERLLAFARTAEVADPTVGLLLAVEARRFWGDVGSPIQAGLSEVESLDALHRALTARSGFKGWMGSEQVGHMTVLDDGRRLVTHTADTIDVWDVATRTRETSWPYPRDLEQNTDLVFLGTAAATDGSVVAASEPGGVTVLDLPSGAEVLRIDRRSLFTPLAISSDHRWLAAGYSDGLVEVWDLTDPARLVASVSRTTQVSDLEWSPGGDVLAIGANDGSMTLWEPESGTLLWDQEPVATSTPDNAAVGFLFSSDGDRVVVSAQTSKDAVGTGRASGVRAIRVLDTSNGFDLIEPIIDEFNRTGIAWLDAAEDTVVATPSSVGPVSVFDVAIDDELERRPIRELGGRKTGAAWGIGIFPELGVVATGGSSGIELRSIDGSGPLSSIAPLAPAQQAVRTDRVNLIGAFTADNGDYITSMLAPALPHVVELGSPLEPAVEFGSVGGDGPSLIIDQFGDFTLHATPSGFVVRRGVSGEAVGPPIPFEPNKLGSVALSRMGDRLMLDEIDEVVLYDVPSGDRVTALDPGIPLTEVLFTNGKFSLDGTTLNILTYFESASFDAETGDVLWGTDEFGFAFPLTDGSTMVTAESLFDPVIRIRDAETFEEVADPLIGHQSGISWIELHPNGRLLATTGRDGSVRVWDLETSSQLGRELPTDQAGVGIWSPDGTLLAVPTTEGYLIWNYDTDTWADITCEVTGRNLTRAEWEEFGPRTLGYRATCPQYPIEE